MKVERIWIEYIISDKFSFDESIDLLIGGGFTIIGNDKEYGMYMASPETNLHVFVDPVNDKLTIG